MTFYLKITILTSLLLSFLNIYGVHAQQDNMRSYLRRNELADLTKGLSDKEIERALSDLTLSDLDALNKLIETTNNVDYDYEDENGPVGGNNNNNHYKNNKNYNHNNYVVSQRSPQFYGLLDEASPVNNMPLESNVEEDESYDEEPIDDTEHLAQYQVPRTAMRGLRGLRGENLRLKRENAGKEQQPARISVDAEYLKQLENSFPHDQDQTNQEDFDEKKDHVRVKRN